MGTVRYTVVEGEVIAEKRSGVRRQYVPDPLGSTVALLDNTQTKTDTFAYWPYGEESNRTGTTATSFRYVGTLGYYRDSATREYVRARYLDNRAGRWISEDPIAFDGNDWNLYRYVSNQVITYPDTSGTKDCKEMMIEAKNIACLVTKTPTGLKCAKACIEKYFGGHDSSRVKCLTQWCKSGGMKRAVPDPAIPGRCDTKGSCGSSDEGTGAGGSIGICDQSCVGDSPCNCDKNRRATVIHEAIHLCATKSDTTLPIPTLEDLVEKITLCIRKCNP